MLSLTACPEPGCDAPAEIVDRVTLPSTDQPVEHARIRCVRRHWFLLPLSMLRSPPQDVPAPRSGHVATSVRAVLPESGR
jgi:hypothetical protein